MAFGSKENKTPVQVPAHIGIIMDGNGRWAKKRGLPRTAGHTAGAQNFRTITRYASSIGVKYLTLYAFSTENWSRPAEEVSALMKLFHQYLEEALRDFMDENIRVRFIGDISAFAPDLQALIHRVEEASSVKTGMVLNLAMNYGGRAEITRAARILAERVKNGELSPEDITEETLVRAWEKRGELAQVNSLEAYCLTAARNLALDTIAKKEHQNLSLDEDAFDRPDASRSPQEELEHSEKLASVRQIINSLPEKQRTVVQLRDIEGLSYSEIAAVTGWTEEVVKVTLHRARKFIKLEYLKLEHHGL